MILAIYEYSIRIIKHLKETEAIKIKKGDEKNISKQKKVDILNAISLLKQKGLITINNDNKIIEVTLKE